MTTAVFNIFWAVVFLPLVGAIVSFLAERPRRAAQTCVAFTVLTAVAALFVLGWRLSHWSLPYENTLSFWLMHPAESVIFPSQFNPQFGIRVDTFSVAFAALFSVLAAAGQWVSVASMRNDQALRRTMWLTSLFVFTVLGAVASPNLFQFWVCFAGSSVLAFLVGLHYWENQRLTSAVVRAFILDRAADLILLLGLIFAFFKLGVNASSSPLPAGVSAGGNADPWNFAVLSGTWNLAASGQVLGVGARTLTLLAIIFLVAAVMRSFQAPMSILFLNTADLPLPAVGLVGVGSVLIAATLLVRTYSLFSLVPQVLSAMAIYAAASAAILSFKMLGQRNLVRCGICALLTQIALALATLGMGGYSPAIFMVFTLLPAAMLFFVVANNISRAYRSRSIEDMGGTWRYMKGSTAALLIWAISVSGACLSVYNLFSAVLRNQTPRPVPPRITPMPFGAPAPVFAQSRAVAWVVLVLAAAALIFLAIGVWRCFVGIAAGHPAPRRGFDPARLRDIKLGGGRIVALLAVCTVATVLAGLPGITAFHSGELQIPALTFSHFIFFGDVHQRLDLDFLALTANIVVVVAGVVLAWRMAKAPRLLAFLGAVPTAFSNAAEVRLTAAGTLVAGSLDWGANVIRRLENEFIGVTGQAISDGFQSASEASRRLAFVSPVSILVAAVAIIGLGICLILGVSHHFPIELR